MRLSKCSSINDISAGPWLVSCLRYDGRLRNVRRSPKFGRCWCSGGWCSSCWSNTLSICRTVFAAKLSFFTRILAAVREGTVWCTVLAFRWIYFFRLLLHTSRNVGAADTTVFTFGSIFALLSKKKILHVSFYQKQKKNLQQSGKAESGAPFLHNGFFGRSVGFVGGAVDLKADVGTVGGGGR